MSLIKCPVCEKEISPNVSSCPYCGEPIKEKKMRTLTLTRAYTFFGPQLAYDLHLDGMPIGSLAKGKTFQCEISTESHMLYPVWPHPDSRTVHDSQSIQIPEGESPVSYELKWRAGFLGTTDTAYFE